MAPLWICADLRSDGIAVGTGRAGWFRRRLLSSTEAPLPPWSRGDSLSESSAAAPALAGAVAALAASVGARAEGVLLALPDRWFKIGLVSPKAGREKVRMGEYARWKLQVDWNLREEGIYHDWQAVGGPRGEAPSILLVATERQVIDVMTSVGEAVGAPVMMCVPRAVAAWNRAASSLRGPGPTAALLRDGDSFTFFGADRGRLRYLRSRRSDIPSDREAEEGETFRHFRETLGKEAAELPLQEWGGGAAVLEGLLSHPLLSGAFA